MYLTLNARDMDLLTTKRLSIYAIPYGSGECQVGDVLEVKEPFKKITCQIYRREDGESVHEDTIAGIMYRVDGKCILEGGVEPPNTETYYSEIEEAPKWCSAKLMPDYAIRRSVVVSGVQEKPLSAFSEQDMKEFDLYYNEPQLLMEGFLPIKNHERVYQWWKQRYKSTLKDCSDPMAIVLRLVST